MAMMTSSNRRPVGWRTRGLAPRRSSDVPMRPLPAHRRLGAMIARHATRRRLALVGLASVALHLLLAALVLLWPGIDPPEPPTELPSPVAMVFEPPNEGQRAVPTPTPDQPPQLVRPPAAPAPTETAEPLPVPPPPPPPPPPPDTPTRRPDPAPVRPRPPVARTEPSFPMPQSYSFGGPTTPRQAGPPAAVGALGSAVTGESSFGQFAKLTAGQVAPSWMNALHDWWQRNGYYPSQAVALQQSGRVRIQIVVDRSGKVRSVELFGASGSPWLNMGAQDVFRGATVPPFPPNTRDDQVTLELTINYILTRQ